MGFTGVKYHPTKKGPHNSTFQIVVWNIFWNFHLDPLGNDQIWAYFSNGLVKNHQLGYGFGCIDGWSMIEPGLAPAELSALLRLFKRRDRSNRLREPVEQHEEVTGFFSGKERNKRERERESEMFDEMLDEFYLIWLFLLGGGVKDEGSFSFGKEMQQPSQCQVPELREAWHWQMPYAFAQEQLVLEILAGSTPQDAIVILVTVQGIFVLDRAKRHRLPL